MEEIKEARKAIFFAITLSVVWLLITGSIKEELRTKRLVEEMGVWVLLSEAVQEAVQRDEQAIGILDYPGAFASVPVGGVVQSYRSAVFDNRGNEGFHTHSLAVNPPWTPGETVRFALTRVEAPGGLMIFKISSEDSLINFSNYHVGEFRDGLLEVHSQVPEGLEHVRSYYDALYLDGGLRGPNSADAVFSFLSSKGWKGQTEQDLSSTDEVVAKAITEVRQQRHTVASLPLTASLLPSAVGMLLAISAFSLAGPIIRIHTDKVDLSSATWTFAIHPESSSQAYLAPLQIIAAGFCVGVLALAGLNILDFRTLLRPDEVGLLYVGVVGASLMTITAVVFFRVVFLRIHA